MKPIYKLTFATAIATTLSAGMMAGLPRSDADDIPDACVWADVHVENVTSTTIKVDTTGSTCPSVPPNPADPCPGGTNRHQPIDQPPVHITALVCVKDLL